MTKITFSGLLTLMMFLAVPATLFADIAGTEEIVAEQSSTLDRENLVLTLEREEVRGELERFGVNPDQAVERVAAMSDEEIRVLTEGIEQQPVGAGLTSILLLVIIILLLL